MRCSPKCKEKPPREKQALQLIGDVTEDRADLAAEQSECSNRNYSNKGNYECILRKPLSSFIS